MVALPNSPAEAAIMWQRQLLAAHEAIQALFVFNYETLPNFAEATKESLGVEPATCSILCSLTGDFVLCGASRPHASAGSTCA